MNKQITMLLLIIPIIAIFSLSNSKTDCISCYSVSNQTSIEYYEYKEFPEIEYLRPCVESWVKQLKPIMDISHTEQFIKIEYDKGKIAYIEILNGTLTPLRKERYTLYNDSILMEFSGLTVSQPGYIIYEFDNELLKRKSTFVACLDLVYCIFSEFQYKYWLKTSNPKYIYKYFYAREFAGCDKDYREEYNEHGDFINKKEIIK